MQFHRILVEKINEITVSNIGMKKKQKILEQFQYKCKHETVNVLVRFPRNQCECTYESTIQFIERVAEM